MEVMFILLVILTTHSINAQGQPSPGYYPSSKTSPIAFERGFTNLWGLQHQILQQGTLTMWLDRSSGSGFKSLQPYRSGYFSAAIKLQPGYTAGVITSFYLSNSEEYPNHHDEIDIEFLGTTPDKPYTLQTNVFAEGSGDGRVIGREMRFYLWFDPTRDFHNYAIFWSPSEIIFFVDDIPIRRYPMKSVSTFPLRPMWVYGSIWDASSWATEDGKYRVDYRYQPFLAQYTNFKLSGCTTAASSFCRPPWVEPFGPRGLSQQQTLAMEWVQRNHLVYYYCTDPTRDHTLTPEC
ncbi:hypothetical protein Nepgr_014357 [Nepenthes gracilis]|uniref:Xyloglucan endotransglucosylase/hydrolase n=1 Tax=Nepenthes gracilis TaxID=150966 RepID=A0AAD3SL07_NEPGR|nr:hypothetical protein Nepgr_014357 [Nepenthes gracilis]